MPTRIGLEAEAGAARLVGVDALTLEVTNVGLEVNLVDREGAAVLDFARTALDVVTGPGTQRRMSLDGADGEVLRVVADVKIAIDDYVHVSGSAAFEKRVTEVTLADGSTVNADVLTIGAADVEAFVGLDGPYRVDSNGDGAIDAQDTPNADAIGLSLGDVDRALGIFYAQAGAQDAADQSLQGVTWTALTARAAAVEVVGVPMLTLSATDFFVEVNAVHGLATGLDPDTHVIDFKVDPVDVRTGPDSSLTLRMDGQRGEAVRAYGTVDVRVGDFLWLGGTLGFEQYRQTVTLTEGGTVDSRLMVLTGADVSARLATSSGADAIGVAMTGLDFGLVLAQADAPGDARSWLSVRGQADSVAILGTQALGVTLSGSNVMFAANVGLGSAADGSANRTTLDWRGAVSYTHLRAHETKANLGCRLLLEKKKR